MNLKAAEHSTTHAPWQPEAALVLPSWSLTLNRLALG